MDWSQIIFLVCALVFSIGSVYLLRVGKEKKWFKSGEEVQAILMANLALDLLKNLGVLDTDLFAVRMAYEMADFLNEIKNQYNNEEMVEQLCYDHLITLFEDEGIEVNAELRDNLLTVIKILVV